VLSFLSFFLFLMSTVGSSLQHSFPSYLSWTLFNRFKRISVENAEGCDSNLSLLLENVNCCTRFEEDIHLFHSDCSFCCFSHSANSTTDQCRGGYFSFETSLHAIKQSVMATSLFKPSPKAQDYLNRVKAFLKENAIPIEKELEEQHSKLPNR
jgi:hypothetical protein